MGMFDSMYDAAGDEWQTKAFHCALDRYRVGDALPDVDKPNFQVEVLGGRGTNPREFLNSYATIRDGALASIDDPRDETLPLRDYGGFWVINERKN